MGAQPLIAAVDPLSFFLVLGLSSSLTCLWTSFSTGTHHMTQCANLHSPSACCVFFSFWKLTLFCFSVVLCQSSTMTGFLFFFLLVSFSKDPMALSSLVSFSKDPSSSSSSSSFTTRSSFCPSFALLPLLTWPSGVAFSKAGSAAFSKAVFCFFSYSYIGWKMKQLDFCLFCSLFQSCSLLYQAFLCIWPCNDQVGPLLMSRLGVAVWVGGPTATRLVFAIQAIVL